MLSDPHGLEPRPTASGPMAPPEPRPRALPAAAPPSARAGTAPRRFRRDRRGTAAMEFALILPVMLTIWAGMSELSHAIDEWRKLTLLARTVSDMTALGDAENPVDASLMTDIFASAPKVMRPFDTSSVKIVVSAMGYDLSKFGLFPRVCSSYANANGTPRPVGSATDLALPPGYPYDGARYVLTEASIVYTPMIGGALVRLVNGVGTITLRASIPWPTRGGKSYNSNAYSEVIVPATNAKPCDVNAT